MSAPSGNPLAMTAGIKTLEGLKTPVIAYGRSPDGIEWNARDGEPVRHVFNKIRLPQRRRFIVDGVGFVFGEHMKRIGEGDGFAVYVDHEQPAGRRGASLPNMAQ